MLLLVLLALVAPAQAAPAKVKVTWPATTNVLPGATLSVKVTSPHRRAQLAFVRVSRRATLARRTLRTGRFTVTVPQGEGVSYELRATVAGRRTVKRFTTPQPTPPPPVIGPAPASPPAASVVVPAPAPAATPTPTPTPTPVADCAVGNTGRAMLTIGARVTVTNLGPGCLDVPVGLRLTWINADGDVIPVDCRGNAMPIGGKEPPCIGLPAFEVLRAGQSVTRVFSVPTGLAPGTYRVSALGAETTVTLP